jgi:type II secretory pathway pseudopilin PulG
MNKATILAVILLAIIAAGALMVNREMRDATARPAVQRQLSQARLVQFAEALTQYRNEHHTWPDTTAQLLRAAKLPQTATMIRGAGIYRYRKPPADATPDTLVMWSERLHDGVAKGDPWGSEGQIADKPIPPIGYALGTDLKLLELTPEEWARRKPPAEMRAGEPTNDTGTNAAPQP